MLKIERLHWDTEFFKLNVGKLVVYDEAAFDPVRFLQEASDQKLDLVYVVKVHGMLSGAKVLQAGLELVDTQLTLSKRFHGPDYLDIPYDFRTDLTTREREECYEIAEETSVVSRFYHETGIGVEKTKELYRTWIDNALNQSFSDGLFVVADAGAVSGIHVIRTDAPNRAGYFTLTGVGHAYRRKGLGRKLWLQSFGYWANEHDIEIIRSPFSLLNAESLNFHLRMGFDNVEEVRYIYHFRNSNG